LHSDPCIVRIGNVEGANDMKWLQRNLVALVVAGALSVGLAGPAAAQVAIGDGLVNVQIGDIEVLKNSNIGIAAEVVAQVCGISISNVAVLAEQVDRGGRERTVCTSQGQDVVISNNVP
jgi:hypothetical protein